MVAIDAHIRFYSNLDEVAFFHWAKKIPCVESFDPVTLFVKSSKLSEPDLRDLIAIMYRYKLPMAQLQQFCNPSNEHWFKSKKMYWYRRVFAA